ncbi:MAG: preprotein translocase subunit SecE [Clostridia bacterium]|nr:preprotein translocase subunit SecE [Clostridia bacterium]
MEETKNKTASQPEKAKKDSKKENKSGQFLAEHRAEMRKITWPNRQELAKETVTVIIISLLVGAIIFCMDTALSWSYEKLMKIGGGESSSNSVDTSVPIDLSGSDLPEGVEIVTGAVEEEAAAPDADTASDNADAEGAENAADEAAPAEDGAAEANADSEAAAENADSEAADTANAGE